MTIETVVMTDPDHGPGLKWIMVQIQAIYGENIVC